MGIWKDFFTKPLSQAEGQFAIAIAIGTAAVLASPTGAKERQAEYVQTIQNGNPETERLHIPAGLRPDFVYVSTHAPADGHTRDDAELIRETYKHFEETHGRPFDPKQDDKVPAMILDV